MNQIEKTFTISGMSCGGCVNSLTRVLKTVPGIEPLKIEVGRAQLRLDESVTSQVVNDAVARAGFQVTSEVQS
jgi:copper chaperone